MAPKDPTVFQKGRFRAIRGMRSIAHFIFNTLGVRFLLALISAFALWWFVVPGPESNGTASTAIGNYRTVPVVVQHVGNPADGYAVTGIQVTPPTITIQGAVPGLGDADYAKTEAIDITGAKATITRVVPLDLPPGVSSTTFSAVTVSIYIAPLPGQITADVPVLVKNLGSNLTASVAPEVVRVTLKGPLPKLNTLDIVPFVDVAGRGAGSYVLPVQLTTPPDITVQIEPADVTVTLAAIK